MGQLIADNYLILLSINFILFVFLIWYFRPKKKTNSDILKELN